MVVTPCFTLNYSDLWRKPHPDGSLVAKPSVYSTSSCGLLVSSTRSLISSALSFPAILNVFSIVLTGGFHRGAGIGLGIFSFGFLGLLEVHPLAYLKNWPLYLTHPWFVWSHSAVFRGFMECIVIIFYCTEVYFDLIHFQSLLHWWEIKYELQEKDYILQDCMLGCSKRKGASIY